MNIYENKIRNFFYDTGNIKKAINCSSNVYIYGCSTMCRSIFYHLWINGKMPVAIILSPNDADYIGCHFMNRTVITISEFDSMKDKDSFLLTDFLENVEVALELGLNVQAAFVKPSGKFIAYGAGEVGREFCNWSRALGIELLMYVDKDKNKVGTTINGLPIYSTDKLEKLKYIDAKLIITLDDSISASVAKGLISQYNISENVYLDNYMEIPFRKHGIFIDGNNGGFSSSLLFYLKYLSDKRKRIILWGEEIKADFIKKKLLELKINIAYVITDTPDYDNEQNCFQLFYENPTNTIVFVLQESLLTALNFKQISGLPENMFYWQEYFSLPYHLERYDCLDPSLGYNIHYNNQYSVIAGKPPQKHKRKISVGILGGSTSDGLFSAEVSWPQQLIDVADEHNISLSIYNGAVSGYNVGQEVIKFIRDMSFDDIDILISFSSINECTSFNNGNGYFIPQIQADFTSYILNKMDKSINLKNDIFYGYSEKDIGKHWWHYENVLYSICKEQDIIFRAILQPLAYDKKLTTFEKDALFNVSQPIALDRKDTVDIIRNYARSKMHQSDWIVDFSNIFAGKEDVSAFIDNCHLTTEGNRIIAEAIFEVINNSINL